MATSGDDLLDEAQAELWRAAESLPLPGPARWVAARTVFHGQLSAWPDLARATRHAITALPFESDARQRYPLVLAALERVERWNGLGHRQASPDPHFARAAQLTGAVGDAMQGSRALSRTGDWGPQDRLLAHVESAARLTAAYAEQASTVTFSPMRAGRWLRLAEYARAAAVTPLADRRSPVTAVPIPTVDESSLAGSLDRWHRAALDTTARGPASPSLDLPLIAAALSTVHSAVDAAGLRISDYGDATTTWRAAAAAWPSTIRIPGPVSSETSCRDLSTSYRPHRVRREQSARGTQRGRRRGPDLFRL